MSVFISFLQFLARSLGAHGKYLPPAEGRKNIKDFLKKKNQME
jgi:hypothetical protein